MRLELSDGAVHIARRCEDELQVRQVQGGVRLPEHADMGRAEAEQATPCQKPIADLSQEPAAARPLVQRHDSRHPARTSNGVVVLEALTHTVEPVPDRHLQTAQKFFGADAGHLEQLRRADRAEAQDHLAPGPHLDLPPMLAQARTGHAAVLQDKLGRQGMCFDAEGWPAPGSRQKRPGRTLPTPPPDGPLIVGDARLSLAVVVQVAGDPHGLDTVDESLAQGVAFMHVGDMKGPAFAPVAVTASRPVLGSAEIEENVGVALAPVAKLRPTVEIRRLAAHVEQAVDRA